MEKNELKKIKIDKKYLYHIAITPPDGRVSLWGRIKTKIWNFILPPHIRLTINK